MTDETVQAGFAVRAKQKLKTYWDNYKKQQAEEAAYKRELAKKQKEAYRQSYAEASVKEAAIKAKLDARRISRPSKQQQTRSPGFFSQPMNPAMNSLIYGIPMKEKIKRRIKHHRAKKKTKLKQKIKYIYRTKTPVSSANSADWIMKI